MNSTRLMTDLLRGIFVTGTDTDVGKTIVTAALYRAALTSGTKTVVLKAVQTGVISGRTAPDVEVYHQASEGFSSSSEPQVLEGFEVPCSPHLAARLERRTIDVQSLAERIRSFQRDGFFTLVEGAGGLLAPLNDTETMLDLIRLSGLSALLVFDNRVGCINHALLSLRELRREGVPVLGSVSNSVRATENADIQADNVKTIERLGGVPVLAEMPHLNGPKSWQHAAEAMRPILSNLIENSIEPETSVSGFDDLAAFDRQHLWHPYTSAVDPHPTVPIERARGAVLVTEDDRELIDGMASWWCVIHGYNRPELNAAVRRQLDKTAHVMFGGITHRPAVELARKLLDMAPGNLNRVFFADSGSVSVEVALKMALQFQQARGKPNRQRFMTFRGGYHGDTLGAMSVCDPVNGMHSLFQGMLAQQIFLDRPRIPFGKTQGDFLAETEALESAFERHAGETAAFILEPIVQGAGGMWFYHPDYLKLVRRLCDRFDVLLIADEIATGFGRTGRLFASQWADVEPDIMCVGKALSGGYMTLAATLATDRVAEGISSGGNVFMHGPTFMANPLACAVAGASLDLLADGSWKNDIDRIEKRLRDGLEPCRNRPGVHDVRVLGAIGVVEMEHAVDTRRLQEFFVRRDVWIRPFNRLLYLMPPYCIRDEQLDRLTAAIVEAVETRGE